MFRIFRASHQGFVLNKRTQASVDSNAHRIFGTHRPYLPDGLGTNGSKSDRPSQRGAARRYPSVAERGEQRPTSYKDEDDRAHGPQGGAHIMGLRSEIGGKVQKPRYHITIE
jgi:hypothetical protein